MPFAVVSNVTLNQKIEQNELSNQHCAAQSLRFKLHLPLGCGRHVDVVEFQANLLELRRSNVLRVRSRSKYIAIQR